MSLLTALVASCGADDPGVGEPSTGNAPETDSANVNSPQITSAYKNPVTRVEDAMPGVFIQPFLSCQPSKSEKEPSGQVCTHVSISGATEPGYYFGDQASCDVVRTQRPFWEVPPAAQPDPSDPRLNDTEYMSELAWVKSQVEASGCVCCHDSRQNDGRVGQWDVAAEPIWITTLSDSGLALFGGFADSSVLGAYPASENNGFDRDAVGIPTTDTARMLAFVQREMADRGISEDEARTIPPFGGPIYQASVAEAGPCGAGQGISSDGTIQWTGGEARYVYVLESGAANPGVPPNFDFPAGTLFRLDVRPDREGLASGIAYGTAPEGAAVRVPDDGVPLPLQDGANYKLSVQKDIGFPITNCLFTYGTDVVMAAEATVEPGRCEADPGFGATCASSAECTCAAASHCALSPGAASGVCTATGCKDDASLCPSGWSCFDLSMFAPGQPSICTED